MTLSALIKKGGLRNLATAIPAIAATDEGKKAGMVARIATVAVASSRRSIAEDLEQARHIVAGEDLLPRAWVIEEVRDGGKLKAVKICSAVLQDHLWVVTDRSFETKDELAVYYSEELPELKTKTTEQLREIHNFKLTFPRCRLIQEGAEVDERLE